MKSKGINKLKGSRKLRKNNKHKIMNKLSERHIRDEFRRNCNRQTLIGTSSKSVSRKSAKAKHIVKNARNFDFSSFCLICGNNCNLQKQEGCLVTKEETVTKILETLKERDRTDSFNKSLSDRLNNLSDWSEKGARYHYK